MTHLFIGVLNMSLMGIVIVVAVALMRILLKKAPKKYSYALWGLAFLRLICPFSVKSGVSMMPVSAETIPRDIIYSQNPVIASGLPKLDQTVNRVLTETRSAAAPAGTVAIVLQVGAYFWSVVALVLVLYAVGSYVQLRYRLRYATKFSGDNQCKTPIYVTDQIKTAFVLGLFKPRIYIPEGMEEEPLDYILMHERTHIARLDHLVKPLAYLICCVHWFNPFAWLAYHLMAKDMEMSCDETVMKRSGRDIRCVYSESLYRLSVLQSGIVAPLAFGEIGVKSRVRNVLAYKKPAIWIGVIGVVTVAAAAVFFLTSPGEKMHETPIENGNLLEDQSEGSKSTDKQKTMRELYFDFALKYRLDCLPQFYGTPPQNANEYLHWAAALNPDGQNEETSAMSREYVEKVISAHFETSAIIHQPLPEQWEYDGKNYLAVSQNIAGKPLAVLRELTVSESNGHEIYSLCMDFCVFASEGEAVTANDEQYEGLRKDITEGDYTRLASLNTERFEFFFDAGGKPVFLSHVWEYSGRDVKTGVDMSRFDLVNYLDGAVEVDESTVFRDGYIFGNLTEAEIDSFDGWSTLPDSLIYRAVVYYKSVVSGNERFIQFITDSNYEVKIPDEEDLHYVTPEVPQKIISVENTGEGSNGKPGYRVRLLIDSELYMDVFFGERDGSYLVQGWNVFSGAK